MNNTTKKAIAVILIPIFYVVIIVMGYVYVLFVKFQSPSKNLNIEIENVVFENYKVSNEKIITIWDESVSYHDYAIKLGFKCVNKEHVAQSETQQISFFSSANAAVDPPRPTFEGVLTDSITKVSLFDTYEFSKGVRSDSNIVDFFKGFIQCDDVYEKRLDYLPSLSIEQSVQKYFEDYNDRNFILFRFENNIKPMGAYHQFVLKIEFKSGKVLKGTTPTVKFDNV